MGDFSNMEAKGPAPQIEAMALDPVSDARLMLNKVAEVLTRLNQGLTIDEKLQLRDEFESLSYSFMMVLMDAELTKKDQEGGGE